ncbi:MerR family transcriptional regulator [Exiguobacterium sp. SH0S1]|uniref:MerR family transcriptional regulator n=1 Tax=Exiguobacterium sp. SH0S1 TaxID=2510949 RepID=UPI001038D79F|nr:B12-binding domain-containing protein [Exiguobacterium sp. SH0S1]TCI80180.1 MerR family transcriptional regulator [Exiguobacterium sp. SH0S1]
MPKYSIKTVASLTGVNPTTIRAWERRYQFIEPSRTDSGHRLYSDKDVEKIKWVVEKQREGLTVSQAIQQLHEAPKPKPARLYDEELKDGLMDALLKFDERKAHDLMNRAFNTFSFEKVTKDIISPLLMDIGTRWENGEVTIAHEHFATSFFRARLSTLSLQMPMNPFLPRIICVCAPGEMHEIGLLFVTLYLRQYGFDVIFLGSGFPKEDLSMALHDIDAKCLIFSCTLTEHIANLQEAMRYIQAEHPDLVIGAGGYAVSQQASQFEGAFLGDTPEAWNEWLSTI